MTDLPPPVDDLRSRRRRLLSSVILLAGLAGLVLATREALRASDDVDLPGPVPLVIASVLCGVGLSCSARAWAELVGPPGEPRLLYRAFFVSQLVKYLPAGGVAQVAGQISLSAAHGLPLQRLSLALAVLMWCSVASGTALGSLLVLAPELAGWVRALSPLGLAAPLLVHPRLLSRLLRLGRRVSARIPEPSHLPPSAAIWRALGWCAVNHVAVASGFALLLRAADPSTALLAAGASYVLAWVAGFLILPLPAGLGVREAVLVALVPGLSSGAILTASVAQRFTTIAAEVVAAAISALPARRAGARDDPTEGAT